MVSRHRSAEGWGLDFLQSDTTIGAGQSGGALVDDRGRVVGISGLGDDDGFAYSLVAADVAERLDDLHDGGDDAWEPAPTVGGSTSFEVEPTGGEPAFLYLPYVAEDVDLTIEAPPGAALAIADPGWSTFPWAVDQEGAEMDGDDAYWSLDDAEEIDQDASGAWTVEVLAGLDAIVMVGDPDADGALAVTSSIPLIEIELPYVEADLELGETVTGVVNHLDDSVVYLVDLEAGVSVEVAARSAVGDMGWDLFPLEDTGDTLDEFYADDGGGGLFDLDAVEEITPTVDGPHLLVIYTWDGIATAFEASVTEV